MPQEFSDIQRGFQARKELLYNRNKELLEQILKGFSVHNKRIYTAKELVRDGFLGTQNLQPIVRKTYSTD